MPKVFLILAANIDVRGIFAAILAVLCLINRRVLHRCILYWGRRGIGFLRIRISRRRRYDYGRRCVIAGAVAGIAVTVINYDATAMIMVVPCKSAASECAGQQRCCAGKFQKFFIIVHKK